MTPAEGAVSPRGARVRGGGGFTRLAALGALALVVIAIIVLLVSSGGGGNHYRLLFETGGQLVKGNQVLIGGAPVGSVDDVKLTDNGQAQVDITVNRPLHQGTTAIVRATSLSGIANRYVSLQPGPDNNPELGHDATITEVDTTSPVDLDQLFNTLRGPGAPGPPQRHPGLGDRLRGQRPGGEPDLQVPESLAGGDGSPAPGARP